MVWVLTHEWSVHLLRELTVTYPHRLQHTSIQPLLVPKILPNVLFHQLDIWTITERRWLSEQVYSETVLKWPMCTELYNQLGCVDNHTLCVTQSNNWITFRK